MQQWKDRKVLVLGLGDTGLSMTRWLAARGAHVSVADTRATPPHASALAELPGVALSTGAYEASVFEGTDAIAISPGVDRREPLVADAVRRGVPVVGDIEIFAGALSSISAKRSVRRPPVIAITGSNGKSTVTAMAGEASRAAGWNTVVAGNIGLPVLDALTPIEGGEAMPDVFVLELSSFQLESTASLHADAATVLNITEDHLDRYDGIAGYAAAKARIFEGGGAQVLNRDDSWSMSMALAGRSAVTFGLDAPRSENWGVIDKVIVHGAERVMSLDELPVAGLHNAANALAALALGHAIGLPVEGMVEGLRRFRGLPHRLEQVGELGGITFFDDSKGTNVGATVAALNGMPRPVVLIAGGDGKGQDFSPLAAPIARQARAVVLMGRDADKIGAALNHCGVPLYYVKTMEEAAQRSFEVARAGDAVLMSPACASLDMFRDYAHRAEVFIAAVRRIEAGRQATAQTTVNS